ncbi:hypothetical protein [Allorhodopirellula heiligendammensis]|uniref:Uncharacterized protein n=1 Tax=Allorhodopirellula heiligendammensis TaxID=2714739 RepID=A0A5C6BGN3_9BACT|nr:hypothetical protein [Allorhodopirellula heiligendammensis]TWU10429.1 hypothetical protein Poly21_43330 [Allorhodopirellula heiligendammensis]
MSLVDLLENRSETHSTGTKVVAIILWTCLLGSLAANHAGPQASGSDGTDRQLLLEDRCRELVHQPLFDFPLSRELGVPVWYAPHPRPQSDAPVWSFSVSISR